MFELKRQTVHLFFGAILSVAALYLSKDQFLSIILFLLVFSKMISDMMLSGKPVPFLRSFFRLFEREKDMKKLPGGGLIFFLLGAFLSRSLFSGFESAVGILILAVSDAAATVIGTNFGKSKLPWNKRKTFEGSISFFFTSFFIFYPFISPRFSLLGALILAFLESSDFLDDNFLIPVIAALIMRLFS